jgi:hypothetical protein
MHFQQNMVDGRTEHYTTGFDSAVVVEGGCQRADDYAAPNERRPQWTRQRRLGRCGLAQRGGSSCVARGARRGVARCSGAGMVTWLRCSMQVAGLR